MGPANPETIFRLSSPALIGTRLRRKSTTGKPSGPILEIPIFSSAPSPPLSPMATKRARPRSANGCLRAIRTTTWRALRSQFTISNKDNLRAREPTWRAATQTRARDVTTALLTAWCFAGQSDLHHALDTLDRIHDRSVIAFRDYHAGLIANLLGNPAEAQRRLKSAYDNDKNSLRFADAYARALAAAGDMAGATKVYEAFAAVVPHHPLIERALADLKTNQALDPVVHNAKEGVAEALYGLGSAGSRQGDELPALVYLRLSLYLRPSSDLTAVTLGSLFEQLKQADQVIAAYQLVPASSPLENER